MKRLPCGFRGCLQRVSLSGFQESDISETEKALTHKEITKRAQRAPKNDSEPSNPPSNPRVPREHLHLPKAPQAELKARMIATTFAIISTRQAKRPPQQMQKRLNQVPFNVVFAISSRLSGSGSLSKVSGTILQNIMKKVSFWKAGHLRLGTLFSITLARKFVLCLFLL